MQSAIEMAPTRAADADHPVHPLIASRWSPRAYSERPVSRETLRSVLEAGRWAPSAANMQPWHFIVASKAESEAYRRLLGVLMEGNTRWAQQAPVLLLAVAKLYTDREGNVNQRSFYDLGLAVGTLTVQATALGLAVHQMGGFYAEKAREAFHIPDGYEPLAAIAIGYEGDPETLPEDLRERERAPRTRRPLAEFVFDGEWGQPSPLVQQGS